MGPLQFDIPARGPDSVDVLVWPTPQYPYIRTYIRPAAGGAAIFDKWDYVPPQGQMPIRGTWRPLPPGRYTMNIMYSSDGTTSGGRWAGARDFMITGQPGPGDGLGGGPEPPTPGRGGSVRIGGNFAGQIATPYIWTGSWQPAAAYVNAGGWKRGQ